MHISKYDKEQKNFITLIPSDMPNLNVIRLILRELPPFEIGTYLVLPPIFRKWRPVSFYWANVRQISKNKTYLVWCLLLTCKITTKYTVYVQRNWPFTICTCIISKHGFWLPSWTPSWKRQCLSGPIFINFLYLLHTHIIYVWQKIQTDIIFHCYVMHISVSTGTEVTFYYRERNKL